METHQVNLTRKTGSLFRAALVAGFLESRAVVEALDSELDGETLFVGVADNGSPEEVFEFLLEGRDPGTIADELEATVRSFVWRDSDGEEVDVAELFAANAGDLSVLRLLLDFARRADKADRIELGGGAVAPVSFQVHRRLALQDKAKEVLAKSLRARGKTPTRIVRVLTYEGPADDLERQLGRSLPDGVKEFGNGLRVVVSSGSPEDIKTGVAR